MTQRMRVFGIAAAGVGILAIVWTIAAGSHVPAAREQYLAVHDAHVKNLAELMLSMIEPGLEEADVTLRSSASPGTQGICPDANNNRSLTYRGYQVLDYHLGLAGAQLLSFECRQSLIIAKVRRAPANWRCSSINSAPSCYQIPGRPRSQ